MKKITINAPIAKPKMLVWVHNYRSKRKDGKQVWEQGIVGTVKYDLGYKHWSYDVRLIRRTPSKINTFSGYDNGNNPIGLCVGDDDISIKKLVSL